MGLEPASEQRSIDNPAESHSADRAADWIVGQAHSAATEIVDALIEDLRDASTCSSSIRHGPAGHWTCRLAIRQYYLLRRL
jgi:hypothetical protein